MNRFFVGKAMGVKEPKEKILPKALEDKDFIKNKKALTKEKCDRGSCKMKEFNGLNPTKKMNFFAGQQQSSKSFNFNSINNSSSQNHDLTNLKRKSDVFLNTNYNKKDKQTAALKNKFGFYSNQGMKKQSWGKKFNTNLNKDGE